MKSPVSLLDMPDVVMNMILEKIEFRSIFTLRKVCHTLRHYIDDNPPKSPCISISIVVVKKEILMNCDFNDKKNTIVRYRHHENGCSVEHDQMPKILENEDFVNLFSEDLRILLNYQKTPLNRFSLSFKHDATQYSTDYIYGVQLKLKTILEYRKSLLPVEKFVMNAFKEDQILSVLPFLHSKFLKEIWILDPTFWGDSSKIMDINEVVKLEQWKWAERIFVRKCLSTETISHFGHTKAAFITLNHIEIKHVALLENTFLQSNTLKRLRFKYAKFNNEDEFFNILGAPFRDQSGTDRNWYLRIPNSNEVMHIHHITRVQNIVFLRIELSDVPEGAVVLE